MVQCVGLWVESLVWRGQVILGAQRSLGVVCAVWARPAEHRVQVPNFLRVRNTVVKTENVGHASDGARLLLATHGHVPADVEPLWRSFEEADRVGHSVDVIGPAFVLHGHEPMSVKGPDRNTEEGVVSRMEVVLLSVTVVVVVLDGVKVDGLGVVVFVINAVLMAMVVMVAVVAMVAMGAVVVMVAMVAVEVMMAMVVVVVMMVVVAGVSHVFHKVEEVVLGRVHHIGPGLHHAGQCPGEDKGVLGASSHVAF